MLHSIKNECRRIDSRSASPGRAAATAKRVVKISWDELKHVEALSKLDHYLIDDIGLSHTEKCNFARRIAEDRKAARRAAK